MDYFNEEYTSMMFGTTVPLIALEILSYFGLACVFGYLSDLIVLPFWIFLVLIAPWSICFIFEFNSQKSLILYANTIFTTIVLIFFSGLLFYLDASLGGRILSVVTLTAYLLARYFTHQQFHLQEDFFKAKRVWLADRAYFDLCDGEWDEKEEDFWYRYAEEYDEFKRSPEFNRPILNWLESFPWGPTLGLFITVPVILISLYCYFVKPSRPVFILLFGFTVFWLVISIKSLNPMLATRRNTLLFALFNLGLGIIAVANIGLYFSHISPTILEYIGSLFFLAFGFLQVLRYSLIQSLALPWWRSMVVQDELLICKFGCYQFKVPIACLDSLALEKSENKAAVHLTLKDKIQCLKICDNNSVDCSWVHKFFIEEDNEEAPNKSFYFDLAEIYPPWETLSSQKKNRFQS